MFEIGDKVFYIGYGNNSKNLVVTKVTPPLFVEVKGIFTEEKDGIKAEVEKTLTLRRYDLSTKEPINNNNLHEKNKWADLLVIVPNMGGVVKEMYENVLNGKINISPFYQRGLVWSLEQKQRYIEAIYLEKARINITTIVDIFSKSDCYIEVIDGKQRLSTIFQFIENEFSISNGMFFKDLSIHDMRYLLNLNFHYTRIEPAFVKKPITDAQKVELFLEINELGTKMSQEHMDLIKKEYIGDEKC
ncbi:MAG: DUF262 domain-containing protein [Fusobacteriaceae bacterium]